jgi:uncharacterized protein YkwD
VTRQTSLLLRGIALLWAAPAIVFVAGTAAMASGPSEVTAETVPRTARSGCPGQGDASAAFAVQERAMLCLVNRARSARGLAEFATETGLSRAAERKSADILRCDEFSHAACGRDFAYWMERFGYSGAGCSGLAENIAYGTGSLGTPRSIFRAWMRSSGHRRNILGAYGLIGIGLRAGVLEGRGGARVWTQEFAGEGC